MRRKGLFKTLKRISLGRPVPRGVTTFNLIHLEGAIKTTSARLIKPPGDGGIPGTERVVDTRIHAENRTRTSLSHTKVF